MQTETTSLHTNQDIGVFALYTNKQEADIAVMALEKNGVPSEDISMLAPARGGHGDFVYRQHTLLARGALMGFVVGLVFGCSFGFFIDLASLFSFERTASIINPYISVSNVFWSSVLGAVVGTCFGSLAGIGSTLSAAKRYAFYLKEGGIILVVHMKNFAQREVINRILEKTRGQDIAELEENKIWSTIIPEKNRMVRHDIPI